MYLQLCRLWQTLERRMGLRVTGKETFHRCLMFPIIHCLSCCAVLIPIHLPLTCPGHSHNSLQCSATLLVWSLQGHSYSRLHLVINFFLHSLWYWVLHFFLSHKSVSHNVTAFNSENFPEKGWRAFCIWETCRWCLRGHDIYTCNLFYLLTH